MGGIFAYLSCHAPLNEKLNLNWLRLPAAQIAAANKGSWRRGRRRSSGNRQGSSLVSTFFLRLLHLICSLLRQLSLPTFDLAFLISLRRTEAQPPSHFPSLSLSHSHTTYANCCLHSRRDCVILHRTSHDKPEFCWRIHANLSLLTHLILPVYLLGCSQVFPLLDGLFNNPSKARHKSTYSIYRLYIYFTPSQSKNKPELSDTFALPAPTQLIRQSLDYLTFSQSALEFSCFFFWVWGDFGLGRWGQQMDVHSASQFIRNCAQKFYC